MKNRSARNDFTTVCLLVTGFSATPALATWYVNQSDGYYKPQEYHNERFGDFPPADIDQKLFGHLNSEKETEEIKPQTDEASLPSNINQPVSTSNQQALNPALNYYSEQNLQQPAFGSYNQGRPYTSPGMQRHIQNRNKHLSELRNRRSRSSFSGPWNNRGSSFSGPWNNNGSSFNMPWSNNNGSGFSGPWNNRGSGSSFSGPWNNNGSNFSMPMGNNRGNNNGSSFSPFGNGGSWSW